MKRIFLLMVAMIFSLALNASAEGLVLSWNANTESDLAGYKIYYGVTSSNLGTVVDVGKVTTYTITVNPAVTTTYYAVITAYDKSGNESVKSDVVSGTVMVADTTPPAKPTGLKMIIQKILAWLGRFFRIA